MNRRTVLLVVVAAVCGAAAALVGDRWLSPPASSYRDNSAKWSRELADGLVTDRASLPDLVAGTGSVAEQSAIALIATRTGPDEIRGRLQEIASLPASAERDFAINLLLTRYAEIDPGAAVNLVHELDLGSEYLAQVFGVWARTDSMRALAALGKEINAHRALSIGLSIVDALGGDSAALERVSNALPAGIDRTRLQLDFLAQEARRQPDIALHRALQIDTASVRSRAISLVAEEWTASDPAAALAAGMQIEDRSLRTRFLGHIASDWSRKDPDAVLTWLAAGSDDSEFARALASHAYSTLAEHDPHRFLAVSAALPANYSRHAAMLAYQLIAAADPSQAINMLQSVAAGQQRDLIVNAIASGMAKSDPQSALDWAIRQSSGRADTVASVIGTIAVEDTEAALDYAMNLDDESARQHSLRFIAMRSARDPGKVQGVASRLMAIEDPQQRQSALGVLASTWAQMDPHAAAEWAVNNPASAGEQSLAQVAAHLAQQDPDAAIRLAARVPAASREQWLTQVAGGYASADPEGALAWLDQLRGQPHHAAMVETAAQHAAHRSPELAASLIPEISDPKKAALVARTTARNWSQRDPHAAAAWVDQLAAGGDTRAAALPQVASAWMRKDRAAAERWLLSQPADDARDSALQQAVHQLITTDQPIRQLLGAFSNDRARDGAAASAAMMIVQRDGVAAAREFLERNVRDPELRRRTREQLELAGEQSTNWRIYPQ
ncbi:MAG: hypothetical protein WD078_05950 [Woeseia sp.]